MSQKIVSLKFFLVLAIYNYCILTDAVQEKLNSWLLKTQNFLNEVTSPLVRTGQTRKPVTRDALETQDMEDIFMAEQTINNRTPNGVLSLAAIISIEQFSRWVHLSVKLFWLRVMRLSLVPCDLLQYEFYPLRWTILILPLTFSVHIMNFFCSRKGIDN